MNKAMQWTDRIRQVKILLVAAAVIIAVASLVISHFLVHDLSNEERRNMEVWAEAMHSFNNADENTDLNLVLKVINGNNSIPIVVVDDKDNVQTFRNLKIKAKTASDSLSYVSTEAKRMRAKGNVIKIDIDARHGGGAIYVCYDDSLILKRLAIYPLVQLGVVLIFVVVAIFALLTSKRAEQNKVWVGLSKETAHQLGTPISSLMAWVEILKENHPDDELVPEIEKDVNRLQLVADRFSKIGSTPELSESSLVNVAEHVVDYMNRRTSRNVHISEHCTEGDVIALINAPLFEWVMENLCKNAVDAMGAGGGTITIDVFTSHDRAIVEVADTGKGIPRKDIANVFRPGFTTKKRGWGLGLSLAKRIVEEYHKGRIFVKSSEPGKGTTFRIELLMKKLRKE